MQTQAVLMSPPSPVLMQSLAYTLFTVCAHREMEDGLSPGLFPVFTGHDSGSDVPPVHTTIYLTIGWCTVCAAYLEAGPRGMAPIPSTSLVPVMQLWLWKTQMHQVEPVDMDTLPADYLGTHGAQPDEISEHTILVAEILLRQAMEALQPEEIHIVPHLRGIADSSRRPALFFSSGTFGLHALKQLARRALYWTLAWSNGQLYENSVWRLCYPVPHSQLRVPLVAYRAALARADEEDSEATLVEEDSEATLVEEDSDEDSDEDTAQPGLTEAVIGESMVVPQAEAMPELQQVGGGQVDVHSVQDGWDAQSQTAELCHVDDLDSDYEEETSSEQSKTSFEEETETSTSALWVNTIPI